MLKISKYTKTEKVCIVASEPYKSRQSSYPRTAPGRIFLLDVDRRDGIEMRFCFCVCGVCGFTYRVVKRTHARAWYEFSREATVAGKEGACMLMQDMRFSPC